MRCLRSTCRIGLLATCLLSTLSGCGGSPEKTYPVEGVVRLYGKPLELEEGISGTVLFSPLPEDGKKTYTARGKIGADGSYRLTTFDTDDGAVAGKHRVAVIVSVLSASATEGGPAPKPIVPPRYNSGTTSGLEFDVQSESNRIDLDLKSTD